MPTPGCARRARRARGGGSRRCRGGRRWGARPARRARRSACGRRRRSARSPPINPSTNASASAARSGVGPAEPIPVPTRPRSRSTRTANEQTAITIALRVPILANCSRLPAIGTVMAVTSSSGCRADWPGPVKNSSTGIGLVWMRRRDLDRRARGEQRRMGVTGGRGGPEVAADRGAVADRRRADGAGGLGERGEDVLELVDDARVGDGGADAARRRSCDRCVASSGTAVRSRIAGGRALSKLSSTITSVPPAIGSASGWAARASRASASAVGRSTSMWRHPDQRAGSGQPAGIGGESPPAGPYQRAARECGCAEGGRRQLRLGAAAVWAQKRTLTTVRHSQGCRITLTKWERWSRVGGRPLL